MKAKLFLRGFHNISKPDCCDIHSYSSHYWWANKGDKRATPTLCIQRKGEKSSAHPLIDYHHQCTQNLYQEKVVFLRLETRDLSYGHDVIHRVKRGQMSSYLRSWKSHTIFVSFEYDWMVIRFLYLSLCCLSQNFVPYATLNNVCAKSPL